MVGARKYREYVRSGRMIVGQDRGTYGIVEKSEIDQFLREADALAALRDYSKAAEIYGSLFVPQMVAATPDHRHNQFVTVGYAYCLNQLGRSKEAIETLRCLSGAAEKPAEYFVNLSLALIREKKYPGAAATATDGLRLYPDDRDLVGNLLVAQTRRLRSCCRLGGAGDTDGAVENPNVGASRSSV
jgi:tetratricopeptide (TPR) repeat protein